MLELSMDRHSEQSSTTLTFARDNWSQKDWDRHFVSLGLLPAGKARYSSGLNNTVLKKALAEEHGYKCWYQGSRDCESQALLLRTLEIDHIVPKRSSEEILHGALTRSTYQQSYFDVNDPGNLAPICHSCNNERPTDVTWTAGLEDRLHKSEKSRGRIISKVNTWYKKIKLSEAALEALTTANVFDDEIWEILSDTFAELIFRRTNYTPNTFDYYIEAESKQFCFHLTPSAELVASVAEDLQEMFWEDQRIDNYLETDKIEHSYEQNS